MGESVVRLAGDKARIVRLSNAYGGDFSQQTFLSMIIHEALTSGTITLQTSLESAKDYVNVNDVVALLPKIAEGGLHHSYNVAGGVNVTHRELADEIARLTGCMVTQDLNAETTSFPVIDISRIQHEFGFTPSHILHDLPQVIEAYKQYWSKQGDLD
jgi:nucleoside-diphosphate-sugar epimerase